MVPARTIEGDMNKEKITKALEFYAYLGWPVVPFNPHNNKSYIKWKQEASIDMDVISSWVDKYPSCIWAIRTGSKKSGGGGILVVDIDIKDGKPGEENWHLFVNEHDVDLDTVGARSPSGGTHYYYECPDDLELKTGQNHLGEGIDTRGDGGLIFIYPSKRGNSEYQFVSNPHEKKVAPLPKAIANVIKRSHDGAAKQAQIVVDSEDEYNAAVKSLAMLNEHRREVYEEWVEVGMSLSQLDDRGLELWDGWSRQSPKYKMGDCFRKWDSFQPGHGITLKSLHYWAATDSECIRPDVPLPKKKPAKPSEYMAAMEALGWGFRLNVMNDNVEWNGVRLTDPIGAQLHTVLREYGYSFKNYADDCMTTLGLKNSYHPIKAYLESLSWDGEDHVKSLCSHFTDDDDMFDVYLKRWLVGAVARICAHPQGQQNRMLVIDGKQDLGKSYFVRWLCSDMPQMHIEAPISTEDKDDSIRLMSAWVWEVSELGATIRRADREALKFFISKEQVVVRKPYGHADTRRPAAASFIGTVNNEAGFLSDPTGSRRFMAVTMKTIDWRYAIDVEIGQLWAQTYALWKAGEPWQLLEDEKKIATAINAKYEIYDPIEGHIEKYYDIDPARDDWFVPTSDIIDVLKDHGHISGSSYTANTRIAAVLSAKGCSSDKKRLPNGKRPRGWFGVFRDMKVM